MSPRHISARMLAALAIFGAPVAMVNPAASQPSAGQIEAIRQACRADFISYCSGVQPGSREALLCLQHNAPQLSRACSGAISAAAANPVPPQQPASATSQPQQSQPSEQDELRTVHQACTLDDFMSHCSWIQPTSPELVLCLRANAAQLSSGCQIAVRASPSAATEPPVAAPAPAPVTGPKAPAPLPAAVAEPPPAPAAPPAAVATRQPNPEQISALRAACRSDFMSHCSGVQPGSREALLCLERNKAEVSQRCQGALATLGTPATGAEPGPGSATPAAPAASELLPGRRLRPREELAILRVCAFDSRNLCGGIRPGGGRIIGCLARNASQLRPQCRAALVDARG
jgi:Cysteine rich repeat